CSSVLCLLAVLLPAARAEAATPQRFVVIVHPSHDETEVSRKRIADAFLRKTGYWGDRQAIRPVDLEPGSAVRHAFTQKILSRSVSAVKSYWQQRIFSGQELPPPELETDDDVVEYVQRNPGAIGYVSARTPLKGVKVLVVE